MEIPAPTELEKRWIEETQIHNSEPKDSPWYRSWPKNVRKSLKYPNISLNDVFDQSVNRNKNLPYLSILGIDYTYQKVNEKANQIAHALSQHKIGLGDRVGIYFPNIPQFVFAFYGILKTGATVVPISPLYGTEDLSRVIVDSEIKIIFALDLLVPKLEEIKERTPKLVTYYISSLGDLISPVARFVAKLIRKIPKSPPIHLSYLKLYDVFKENATTFSGPKLNPKENIAVIGYTGGTTGIPKGAMLTHFNLVANLHQGREWARIVHPIGIHKKFVGAVPFFHIIGLNAVMLVAMFYDSTVYLFPDPRKYGSILKAIEKYGINYFHGVPTLLKALLKYPDFSKFDVSSLEFVFSGAAPLDPKLGMDFEAKTNALVVEAYGMTETSPMVAANPFERENHQFGSIGLPFPDTEFKIVDPATHEDLPLGEIGEIALKGPQIMQGYLNNPEETANSFWDGYLLTGDLAQIKDDGFVYIVNRKKDMIISSGYKVFPSELEQLAMDNFPEFEEVVVIGSYDEHRGETVKLIAVLKEGAQISKENIIDFFKNRIAVYKIPKIIEFVKNLPKTSIGKTDRKALQEKERSLSTPPI